MKFGEAKVIPYIAVDVGTFAPESQTPEPMSEHARIAALVTDAKDIFAEGRGLRADAEEFIVWARWMGESTGASTWRPVQQSYAADWRAQFRARAQQFKAAIVSKGKDPEAMLERIFSAKEPVRLDYGADVTALARAELQI